MKSFQMTAVVVLTTLDDNMTDDTATLIAREALVEHISDGGDYVQILTVTAEPTSAHHPDAIVAVDLDEADDPFMDDDRPRFTDVADDEG